MITNTSLIDTRYRIAYVEVLVNCLTCTVRNQQINTSALPCFCSQTYCAGYCYGYDSITRDQYLYVAMIVVLYRTNIL